MQQQNSTKKTARKNIYLILLAVGIIVVALAITIALSNRSGGETLEVNKSASYSKTTSQSSSKTNSNTGTGTSSSDKPTTSKPDEPVKKTEYVFPVKNGEVLVNYTEASVVYNQTLNVYTGHMGLDIKADMGADVLCVSDGVIESIETDYLTGTNIIIDHGDGVKSLYNSLEVNEELAVGDTVLMGDVLGTVSTTNRQEYKDGPHLHFEMLKDGKTVNPYDYLESEGK